MTELLIASHLAKALGVHASRITQLKKAGILEKAKRGKKSGRQLYNLDLAKKLIKDSLDPNYTKGTPQVRYKKGGNGNGDSETVEDDSFHYWRRNTEQYKAAEKKLDYEIRVGKYIEREKVERVLFMIGQQLSESLENAPSRTAALVAAKSKKAQEEIYQILRAESVRTRKEITSKLKKVLK